MKVLNAKLHPPSLMDTVERNRLVKVFKENLCKKLISIVAGAGYGKSTLAADALSQTGIDTVWYRLDRHDDDFTAFLTYLKTGILRLISDAGDKVSGNRIDPLPDRKNQVIEFLAMMECKLKLQNLGKPSSRNMN